MLERSLQPVVAVCALLCVATTTGCSFSEQAFPPQPGDVVPMVVEHPVTTRLWLEALHEHGRDVLPDPDEVLLTKDLSNNSTGSPIDVYDRFGLNRARLGRVIGNWSGIQQTAQCSGTTDAAEDGLWDGFESVWVPVRRGIHYSGRLGWAVDEDGRRRRARCVVILPGFYGDHSVLRSRDMATALLSAGLHVLAIEISGHGETDKRYPNSAYTFGYLETKELLDVSTWIRKNAAVTDTGLIGFSWGANTALMTGWYASTLPSASSLTPGDEYRSGVLAFSPIPDYDHFLRTTDGSHKTWNEVVVSRLEDVIRLRQQAKGFEDQSGNFDALARAEFGRVKAVTPEFEAEARQFLQLLPQPGDPGRLDDYDRPFCFVHAANDPLKSAQDVATLVAATDNPNVAAIMLPEGGHVGFAAYARSFFYSVIVNFFDPRTAPTALRR